VVLYFFLGSSPAQEDASNIFITHITTGKNMAIAPNPKEGITNPPKKDIRLPKNVSAMTTAVNTGRKIIHNNPLSTRPQYICPKPGINKDKIAAIPFEWSPIMVLLTLIVFKVYRLICTVRTALDMAVWL